MPAMLAQTDDDTSEEDTPVAPPRGRRKRNRSPVDRFVAQAVSSEDDSEEEESDSASGSGDGPPPPAAANPPVPAAVNVPRALQTLDQVADDVETGDYCYLCEAQFSSEGRSLAYCLVWDFVLRNIESVPTIMAARVRRLYERVVRREMGAVPMDREWPDTSILAHVFGHGATEATTLLSCERKLRAAIKRVMQTEVLSSEQVGTEDFGPVRANLRGIGTLRQLTSQLCSMINKRVLALKNERQAAARNLDRARQKQRTQIGALAEIEDARRDEVHTALARERLRERRRVRVAANKRVRKRRRRR